MEMDIYVNSTKEATPQGNKINSAIKRKNVDSSKSKSGNANAVHPKYFVLFIFQNLFEFYFVDVFLNIL